MTTESSPEEYPLPEFSTNSLANSTSERGGGSKRSVNGGIGEGGESFSTTPGLSSFRPSSSAGVGGGVAAFNISSNSNKHHHHQQQQLNHHPHPLVMMPNCLNKSSSPTTTTTPNVSPGSSMNLSARDRLRQIISSSRSNPLPSPQMSPHPPPSKAPGGGTPAGLGDSDKMMMSSTSHSFNLLPPSAMEMEEKEPGTVDWRAGSISPAGGHESFGQTGEDDVKTCNNNQNLVQERAGGHHHTSNNHVAPSSAGKTPTFSPPNVRGREAGTSFRPSSSGTTIFPAPTPPKPSPLQHLGQQPRGHGNAADGNNDNYHQEDERLLNIETLSTTCLHPRTGLGGGVVGGSNYYSPQQTPHSSSNLFLDGPSPLPTIPHHQQGRPAKRLTSDSSDRRSTAESSRTINNNKSKNSDNHLPPPLTASSILALQEELNSLHQNPQQQN